MPKITDMVCIDESSYKNLAQILMSRIEGHYFNGSIEIGGELWGGRLCATLIVYREPLFDPADPGGAAERIADIVPVWWAFETIAEDGPCDNDFSWREFRSYLFGAKE